MEIKFNCEGAGEVTWRLPSSFTLTSEEKERLRDLLLPHVKHFLQIITVALQTGERGIVNSTIVELNAALKQIATELKGKTR